MAESTSMNDFEKTVKSGINTQTAREMKNKAADLREDIQELGRMAKNAASESLDQLREKSTNYFGQGRERAQQWEKMLEQQIQNHPMSPGYPILPLPLYERRQRENRPVSSEFTRCSLFNIRLDFSGRCRILDGTRSFIYRNCQWAGRSLWAHLDGRSGGGDFFDYARCCDRAVRKTPVDGMIVNRESL